MFTVFYKGSLKDVCKFNEQSVLKSVCSFFPGPEMTKLLQFNEYANV